MARKIFSVLAALVLLTQASCLTLESENPVTSLEEAQVDEALIGTWQGTDDNGRVVFLHLGRSAGDEHENLMAYTWAQVTEEGELGVQSAPIFVSFVGESTFVNMPLPVEQENERWDLAAFEGYEIMLYEAEENELRLYSADQELIKEAIEGDLLEGEINIRESDKGVNNEDIRLTGSSENIFRFLEEGGILFESEPWFVFHRVADQGAPPAQLQPEAP